MKAANIKTLEWGCAKALPCCVHCSSELHSSTTCPDVPSSVDMRMERLNASVRSDIAWWNAFATQWNGCSLLSTTGSQSVELTSDASGHMELWNMV